MARLFENLSGSATVEEQLIEWSRVLDAYYIGSRYSDSHAEGAPYQRYGGLQREEAIIYAGNILEISCCEVKRRVRSASQETGLIDDPQPRIRGRRLKGRTGKMRQ